MICSMLPAYERATKYSEEKITKLRHEISKLSLDSCTVITYGSFARREASQQSDIDYIIVFDNILECSELEEKKKLISDVVGKIVPVAPSPGGAFGHIIKRSDLLANLGGQEDTNDTLTRRLLLLLEGEWLSNGEMFQILRKQLIECYMDTTRRDHQLSLFLLNDVIRYWRTMTVDYRHKTTEGQKPWAIRNIKLIFSRKLMYASGLFSVGMTLDRTHADKIAILEDLFNRPVIERMRYICDGHHLEKALSIYDKFLENFEDPEFRTALLGVKIGDHDNLHFRSLKNEGYHFTRHLMGAFEETFHGTHPIHRAIIF